jgi:cytochrome c-type biogenesis protein CcmH
MTAFLLFAGLLSVAAVLFVIRPLLRTRGPTPPSAIAAMVVALAVIGISAVLYSLLGNPAALRPAPGGDGARADIAALARHVEQAPRDVSAWLALGQAYGQSGQYPLALHAYEQANQLSNGRDAAALAGMGEALLLQGDRSQITQASADIERALQLDPRSPKGLFYGAVLAYQSGRLDIARDRFAAMLTLTPPPPENVRVALQRQIQSIDAQLHPRVDAATAIHLQVSLAPKLASKVPPNASLFVFVQSPDGGPPLAVKRTSAELPQEVELSAADAMIAQRAVRPGEKVTVVARISASGNPLAGRGDLYGQIEYVAGKTGPRALLIDKLSP